MAEKLPLGVYESEEMRPVYMPNGTEPHPTHQSYMNGEHQVKEDASNGPNITPKTNHSAIANGNSAQNSAARDLQQVNEMRAQLQNDRIVNSNGTGEYLATRENLLNGEIATPSERVEDCNYKGPVPLQNGENGFKPINPTSAANQVEAEWIEQYEPGVYITLMALHDGTRDLKRVRFSRRRFREHQAYI